MVKRLWIVGDGFESSEGKVKRFEKNGLEKI
jgi:hypothetical protein